MGGRMSFDELTTTGLSRAFSARRGLPEAAASTLGVRDSDGLALELAGRTCCLTMLAGSGSRWVASLEAARAAGRDMGADPRAPRGLYPVRNAMPFGPDPAPIASYALAAVRDLGHHVIVVRGWEREIEERILGPFGFAPGSYRFATQGAPGGKPRGHGDAAFQTLGLWSGYDYVTVNFGGDASSPLTALASLAAMAALERELGDRAPGLLLPAALVDSPAYPIGLGPGGLPASFGHAKLRGGAAKAGGAVESGAAGYTNVGLRVYRAEALREAIESIRERYWSPDGGYAIPGNAPASDDLGGEFALDNVDALLAAEGRARLLPIAKPEELSPVKSLDDLPRFERDVGSVCRDWSGPGR
ncbi:MAG TPA: hypothetical protein PLQ29_01350 [Spirochaetales bacterium]|nr:hypothetical protein [Spirochaetales bacterium]HPG85317.1 hypothetical protein [Spirochaetales bacterium]